MHKSTHIHIHALTRTRTRTYTHVYARSLTQSDEALALNYF